MNNYEIGLEDAQESEIKLSRRKKVIKRCVNCGNYKDLSNGETIEYTKDRNLKIVSVCDINCKKSFIKKEIADIENRIEWLKSELE